MSANLKRPRETELRRSIKRRRLKSNPLDAVRKLVKGCKGEATQALQMVFDSFSFETLHQARPSNRYISYLNLQGYSFVGYGNTKVASRSSASKVALVYLIDDLKDEFGDILSTDEVPLTTDRDEIDESLADAIAFLVLDKYRELREPNRNLPWFKVLAGVVMIRRNDHKTAEVVVLATGTKCVETKNVQRNGTVILDSHAEILTKRAFQRYLYSQLELLRAKADSILVQTNDRTCKVSQEISFYVYVSSAPCGDCRIFAVSDRDNFVDKHPNRINRGVLRIKLDGGNSTVPIKNSAKYEADNRLMVMSCSDKLLKMNVLGMQGALLSRYIEPVYLAGIVIGDLFQKSHITRALHGRIAESTFPAPFRLNAVPILGTADPNPTITKCPKSSVNWIRGEQIEIVNSMTGKTETKEMSRLCKRKLFEEFMKFEKDGGRLNGARKTYGDFKATSDRYQTTKKMLYNFLENKNLGRWIRRDIYDKFFLESD